jgi:glycosyltransferase involved in cell wall biosynthesis
MTSAESSRTPGDGIRVTHLGKYYPPAPGGIESHVQTLAKAQAGLGAVVSVVCVNHGDASGADIQGRRLASTPTVSTSDELVRLTLLGRRASVARFDICPDLILRMDQLEPSNADLVHLHVPNPTMLLALAVKRLRVPLVISYHSDIVRQKLLVHALRPVERSVFGRAARILSDSPTYPEGSTFLKRYARKLGVLPLGIDLHAYLKPSPAARAFTRRLQSEHGAPLWLSVGRLVYYKGLPNALQALRNVSGKLVVIGTGPLEADLRRMATACRVADRVVWMGYRDFEEVVGAYHAATALWFPSNARSEGFGLVQVEAMASGCPVINSAIPGSGVSWVSRHEETGLTVPMNAPGELAAAANRLLHEPGLRERLAAGARARACQEFDHRLMAQRCLRAYRSILAGIEMDDRVSLRRSA